MTIPGLYLIERVGRRVPLVIGGLWQATWLLIFAIIGVALPPQDNPTAGIVMIVAACMFIASFAATWGPFIWVIIGETFPLRTRAKQASLATAFNWLGKQHAFLCRLRLLTTILRQLPDRFPHTLR
jgi:SP family sugar:H+ symporter-like MFS transporter